MKWEDVDKQFQYEWVCANRIQTDIECPRCGGKIYKRTDIVLDTYPQQYCYECDCGWTGYARR